MSYKIPETKFKDYPAVHDVLYDALGKSFNNDEIDAMVMALPNDIQWVGIQWGWGDTEFRDKVYQWGWGDTEFRDKVYEHYKNMLEVDFDKIEFVESPTDIVDAAVVDYNNRKKLMIYDQ